MEPQKVAKPLITKAVEHSLTLKFEDIPDATKASAKTLILDSLGVGLAGSSTTESGWLQDFATKNSSGQTSNGWNMNQKLDAANAAMINAHQMHTLEFDAIHEPAVVHPMTVVFPSVVAWMQRAHVTQGYVPNGKDLIKAVCVGVDIAGGLGDVTTSPLQFFRPATAGAIGAVAAINSISSPTTEQAMSALGVVYGQLSGTMQAHTEGAQVLALQVGFNARSAVNAIDLAQLGFVGPEYILEGKYGYFSLFEKAGNPEDLMNRLGQQWEVDRTSLKPFPSGRATHGALDAILQLRSEFNLTRDQIKSITVTVPPMVYNLVGRRPDVDMPVGAARLCLAYLIPLAIDTGQVTLDCYTDENLRNPELYDWAQRISVTPDNNPDLNAFDPQKVSITLNSGETLEKVMPYSLGSPTNPMSESQVLAKLKGNLELVGRNSLFEDIVKTVDQLENQSDLSTLFGSL
jgi:2-methylcitrate dehydratase PrpD